MQVFKLNMTVREWGLLVVLFLVEFTRGALFLTFLPIYSVKFLGISTAAVGMSVSAHYLVETLFKGTAGLFFDRHGRIIILIGLTTSFVGIIGLAYAKNSILQFAAAAILGFGVSPLWLAVISLVAPVEMPNRASRMGAIFAFWLGGMGSGPVLINFFISRSYHSAAALLISLFGIAVILAYFAFPNQANSYGSDVNSGLWQELKRLANLSTVTRVLLPGMFLQTLAASLLLPILPLYADNVLGLNHSQYAILLICGGAGTLLFLIPMGKLVDRLPLKLLLVTGFGLSALLLFTFTLSNNLLYVYSLAALVGTAYAIVLPAWNALLAKVISVEMQATGWGIFGTIEGLGIATGPALGGVIAELLGPVGTIYCSSFVLSIMALFYIMYPINITLKGEG